VWFFLLVALVTHGHAAEDGAKETKGDLVRPVIPRVWDDEAIAGLELPLADPAATPKHISSDYYYRIPVRLIFRSYPAYALGREPAGYLEWLATREPEAAFDAAALASEADWIAAGEIVFDAPIFYDAVVKAANLQDPAWYEMTHVPVASDGTLPYFRYVIREKGKLELGTISCAMCHTRVLPDGSVVKGAQGNFPFDLAAAFRPELRFTPERLRAIERSLFGAPWVEPDPQAGLDQRSIAEIAAWHAAIPAGVIARQGASPQHPIQVSDLIGIQDLRYLDHTGLVRQRSIADLMRYSALNQGADDLASYAGFIPAARDFRTPPDPEKLGRYSDEQLHALARYVYSLRPPPNPNPFDERAARGQRVFERERCGSCHTPPLYTNNKLTPAEGFDVPEEHRQNELVSLRSVGTDPHLTLGSRRGTGYYRVPSLRGLWYRGPFEHEGSVATLEDWFDPRRLRDDYVPTGFRGAGVETRAVPGHRYGLDLTPGEKADLIAFLKTL
jgi:hypothetical protein